MESERIKTLKFEDSFTKLRSGKELDTSLHDLLGQNYFSVIEYQSRGFGGPYSLSIGLADNRLIFNIKGNKKDKTKPAKISVPLRSFRSVIKDYFLICESHQEMLKHGMLDKVEALDMGRRSVHNEGAEILLQLLEKKINMDFETARRLFTIITVLHLA